MLKLYNLSLFLNKEEFQSLRNACNEEGDNMVLNNTHGPFFFINYGEYPSWENSIKIEAAVSEEDFDIQAKFLKILDKEFSDTIQLESGCEYRFKSIWLKNTGLKSIEFSTSLLHFRADKNEILLKAT